jgi:transcriptional regulator with XRE-family HTH domain
VMGKRPKAGPHASEPLPEDAFLKELGLRLRQARKRAGLSQSELASRIGRSQSFIYLVEDGQQNSHIGNLKQLADALHVQLRDMLPGSPEIGDMEEALSQSEKSLTELSIRLAEAGQQVNHALTQLEQRRKLIHLQPSDPGDKTRKR